MSDTAVDLEKQAAAANKANADYQDPVSTTRLNRVPQIPDPVAVAEQQAANQGGSREPNESYDGVKIAKDGSRSGA